MCILVVVMLTGCHKTWVSSDGRVEGGLGTNQFRLAEGRIEYCMKSDLLWVSYLVGMTSNAIRVRDVKHVVTELNGLKAAVETVQLDGKFAGCEEPILLGHDEIVARLSGLAEQLKVDVNTIRGIFVENKEGFITAIIALLEQRDNELNAGAATRAKPGSGDARRNAPSLDVPVHTKGGPKP